MPNRILVTGFGPFSKTTDNPSAVLAATCPENRILEVSWNAVDMWLESGEADEFDILLHLGYADRHFMTPELYARNLYGSDADVKGEIREGEIQTGGPLLLESTLWTPEQLSSVLMDSHLRISEDAGTYLCNYIAYRSVQRFPTKRVGFLHVPSFEKVPQERQIDALKSLLIKINDS